MGIYEHPEVLGDFRWPKRKCAVPPIRRLGLPLIRDFMRRTK